LGTHSIIFMVGNLAEDWASEGAGWGKTVNSPFTIMSRESERGAPV
jgi:hypothetical protein